MADNSGGSEAAAAPDPSRHAFWAWKERLLAASGDPDAADGVARADGDQRSRVGFLCWCTLFNLLLVIGSALLMIFVQPLTAGQAAFVATRVLGYSGLAASLCLASFLSYLWNAVATGHTNDQRTIDSMM